MCPASHAPYKWDYWPHDDVRAECRFVGLTNLGATCYLASTIQQLYMIPEARQAVFTAKVSPPRRYTRNRDSPSSYMGRIL